MPRCGGPFCTLEKEESSAGPFDGSVRRSANNLSSSQIDACAIWPSTMAI